MDKAEKKQKNELLNDVAQVLKERKKNVPPEKIPEKSMMENFLCKIATKTENMIHYDAKEVYYLKAIKAYRKMREKFLQALQQSQNEAIKNQLFHDENAADPPISKEKWEQGEESYHFDKRYLGSGSQGWELEEYYLIEINIMGHKVKKKFWRPPLPFDPDFWIMHHYGSSFYNKTLASRKFPKEPKPKKPDNAENLIICKFIVLTVIHENVRATLQCQKLFSSCDNEWVWELWGSILGCKSASDYNSYDDRTQKINEAFNNVKTYLDGLPADIPTTKIKKSTKKGRKKKQKKSKKNIKDRFSFAPGQVLFDETDLELPTGLTIEVFEKLYEKFGIAVLYENLSDDSTLGNADEKLRRAKKVISDKLNNHKVPCQVVTKPRESYCLRPITPHNKPHKRATRKSH